MGYPARRANAIKDVAEEVEEYFRGRRCSVDGSRFFCRRAAGLEAGNMTVGEERVNSYGWEDAARNFLSDLRFAGRQLLKHPVFTVTAT
ncbi:MAG TPA: hypothetical protein VNY78_07225, partial [Edaphobacter sp.]|nr:hypothetical protein [Edaphobacter sp.]